MELKSWLEAEAGRSAKLAEQVGRSKTAISLWKEAGVPLDCIPAVSKFTGYAVTEGELLRHAMEARIKRSNTEPREDA